MVCILTAEILAILLPCMHIMPMWMDTEKTNVEKNKKHIRSDAHAATSISSALDYSQFSTGLLYHSIIVIPTATFF